MTFPFTSLSLAARQEGLLVAIVIGILFGFVLERAGFGRAPKLAAQFYFRDMTVFKVMFSAIVTAMLGLVVLSTFGLAELRSISESIASWTYVWPMLAGGLLLGAGFIISGYCPGTSIVAAGSGNVDGAITVGGVITGTYLYSELLQIPAFKQFHNSGEKGAWFLYDVVKVPPQLIAAVIAILAIAAFFGAEKLERIVTKQVLIEDVTLRRRRFAFGTIAALAIITAVTVAMPVSAPAAPSATPQSISAAQLARIVVDEPWTVRILDLRDEAAFAKSRVPGAENIKREELNDALTQTIASGRTPVVVTDQPLVLATSNAAQTRALRGGFAAWDAYALKPPAPPSAGANKADVDEYLFRVALNGSLTGMKTAAAPVPTGGAVIAKPKKHGGGCSS